jgi:hypothetical protein
MSGGAGFICLHLVNYVQGKSEVSILGIISEEVFESLSSLSTC